MVPIMLNANELPWSHEGSALNRYPDQQPERLVNCLSNYYQVTNKQLLVTRGSDEAIDLLVRLLCTQGCDQVIICPPTYGMYAVSAALQGASVIEVSLQVKKSYQLDVDAIVRACTQNVKLVFLCSPNNPTGTMLALQDIIDVCNALAGKAIVVVDEAYLEFAQCQSMTEYINQFDNLVVLRTLSKAFGLAAVRCGVLISNATNITCLAKILAPYPIAAMTESLVLQRFSNLNSVRGNIEQIQSERQRVAEVLAQSALVTRVLRSAANFIAFQTKDNDLFYQQCLIAGILIRQLGDFLRVSIGTITENDRLLAVIAQQEKQ